MKSVQQIAILIKANQAIILPFFFVHLQLWIFFGGYIEMCSRIYILDCISCNLFWSYWQFANKNSKQDATVCSSRTVGSHFGVHECTRKGAAAEDTCFCSSYSELSSGHLLMASENMEEVWITGVTWLLYFLPTMVITRSENSLQLIIVMTWGLYSRRVVKNEEVRKWTVTVNFILSEEEPSLAAPSMKNKDERQKERRKIRDHMEVSVIWEEL